MTKNCTSKNYFRNLNYYKDIYKNNYKLIHGRKSDTKDAYDGKIKHIPLEYGCKIKDYI